MQRSELLEAMDACRATNNDLSLPELASLADHLASDPAANRLFDRVQRLDRRLVTAARDVPVPVGLAERILTGVASHATDADVFERASTDVNNCEPVPATDIPPARHRVSRRSWWLAAAAASVLVAAAFEFWPRPVELTAERLREDSGEWAKQLWNSPARWNSFSAEQRAKSSYPLPPTIIAPASRWADVSEEVDRSAIAYDLSSGGGPRAVLFVIRDSEIEAGAAPPSTPQSSTLGLMIGCWQEQGVIYVLVVEGDERSYKNLLKTAPVRPFA